MTSRRIDTTVDELLYAQAKERGIKWCDALALGIKIQLERADTNKTDKLKDRIAELEGAMKHEQEKLHEAEQKEQAEKKRQEDEARQRQEAEKQGKEAKKGKDKAICKIIEKDPQLAKKWLAVKDSEGLMGKVGEFEKLYAAKNIKASSERLLDYRRIKKANHEKSQD